MKTITIRKVLLLLACLLPMAGAHAVSQGDWLLRFGGAQVSPNDGSTGVVANDAIGVDGNAQPFINLTYMLRDNIGLEVLGALPFSHDITLNGSKIAETKQLPPTVSLQYHFIPKGDIRPYVGIGINYTTFFSEKATATITSISLDDSTGLAAQVGVDGDINKEWFWNADLRYINIETTAKTNIGNIDVEINPWVISIGAGIRF